MEHFRNMTLAQIVALAKAANDPIAFSKDLIAYLASQLNEVVREEITERDRRVKQLRKDVGVLQIEFTQ